MERLATLIAGTLALLVLSAPAAASGPELSVPQADLASALECPHGLTHPQNDPILLVHGTGAKPAENWGWNYLDALPRIGYDPCTVELPKRALGDIQVASEYVVFAIRELATETGHVDVFGHSQGTLEPRWAIRWWPAVAASVDDYVSFAGPHHGTSAANLACSLGYCPEAAWQMRRGANFIRALNSVDETPPGPSYTSLYSRNDELVRPTDTAVMEGASNVRIQDVCPLRYVSHVGIVSDAVAYALTLDALQHSGPADPSRIPASTCNRIFMPGISGFEGASPLAALGALGTFFGQGGARSEPPLAPYAQ